MEPSDIDVFDPAHYKKVRRPILEAETLPFWCYTSEPFYRREIDRVFLRSWNMSGARRPFRTPGTIGRWNWSESHFFWRAARMA